MDLGGITSFICTKTGITDQNAKDTCAGFVRYRYRWIYKRFPWHDGLRRDTADTVAGVDSVALPAGVDRVVSIRYGDHFLDPVDDTFFVETDPTIFERQGIPTSYQEYTDWNDNTKRIRLYPIPAVVSTLLIIGKRTLPELTQDASAPVIRGIDEVLIAYAESDMLEYHRQYGKGQTKFAEAEKLFADAVALEQQQTNVPRKAKNLTVAGNSLAEMTDAVCARIGQWTPDTVIVVKEFIRRNYVQVYDAYLWPESLVMARVTSDGEQVILPWYFGSVVSVRSDTNGFALGANDLSTYFAITPQIFEQNTGWAVSYTILTPVAVGRIPPLRERLALVSTDPMDNSQVMIRGESAGDILAESVTLNGTSPAYSENVYDTPLTVAKAITLGNITINGASSGVALGTLKTNERERKRMRLWLQPHGNTSHQCLVLGKRTITPLVQDEDTPAIRNLANYLIHMATSEAYEKSGNQQGAINCKAKADASLQALLDLEVHQNSVGSRVIPYIPESSDLGDMGNSDWLSDKSYHV